MTIGLGTAQFGLDYGISNSSGQVAAQEVESILGYAQSQGICVLDTAPAYGQSEDTLGALADDSFRIVTKTRVDLGSGRTVAEDLDCSLKRLRRDRIHGLLLHRSSALTGPGGEQIYAELVRLRESGRIRRFGVSIYDSRELDAILGRYEIDLIQAPLNVFDQRLLDDGMLRRLKALGVEIHTRSVFLQGLLLMEPGQLEGPLAKYRERLSAFRECCRSMHVTTVEAALGFVQAVAEVDVMLVGVVCRSHLEEIVAASRVNLDVDRLREFACSDEVLINPSQWPQRPVQLVK